MEINQKDRAKSKFKDSLPTETEFLYLNIFEGDGFNIQSWDKPTKTFYNKRTKASKAERKESEWDVT